MSINLKGQKEWTCRRQGCEDRHGNLLTLCDFLAGGTHHSGNPAGRRLADLRTNLQAIWSAVRIWRHVWDCDAVARANCELIFDTALENRLRRRRVDDLRRWQYRSDAYQYMVNQFAHYNLLLFRPEQLPPQEFRRWLQDIADDCVHNAIRRRGAAREVGFDDIGLTSESMPAQNDASDIDPLDLRDLPNCIRKLPPQERQIIEMRLMERPFREIAERLCISLGTVYRRYEEALSMLRQCLLEGDEA